MEELEKRLLEAHRKGLEEVEVVTEPRQPTEGEREEAKGEPIRGEGEREGEHGNLERLEPSENQVEEGMEEGSVRNLETTVAEEKENTMPPPPVTPANSKFSCNSTYWQCALPITLVFKLVLCSLELLSRAGFLTITE